MASPEVTVVLVRAPRSRELPARRAHVALYAGVKPTEVARLLARTLRLPAVCGFLVVMADGARRVVPLSLACLAPELLVTTGNGCVTALVTLADAATTAKSVGKQQEEKQAPKEAKENAQENKEQVDRADARERVGRFVAALRAEQALGAFEAAVLTELCEAQPARVLRAMRGTQSVSQKRQFLLDLAHASEATQSDAAASPASSPLSPPPAMRDAQAEIVHTQLVALARSVFSPQAQSAILAAAAAYRAKRATGAPETGSSQKLELLGVLERLLRKHALPEEQAAHLVGLVLSENRLLLSALQSFRLDFSLPDLEKAVQQIAALGPASSSSSSLITKSPKKRSSSPRKSRSTSTPLATRPLDLLHALHQKQLLTSPEVYILGALVRQQDAQVLAAMAAFQRSRDLPALRDALVAVVEEVTTELSDEEKRRSLNLDDHLRDGAVVENWQNHLTRYVRHWAERNVLAAEYAAVLAKLIAENHNLLQSAYEVFASDGDEPELLDTLERIAKLQRQAEDGAALQQFSQVVDAHCDVLRASEKALVKQLFVRRNELVRAAWEVFEVEKNARDFGDTLLRIARFTSRNDSKRRLVEVVGEMMRRQLLRSHEADGLIRLYEEKNEALLAASEAFESDGDIKELVETLLLVVKHADFGAPPVCSPRHRTSKSDGEVMAAAPSLDQFDPHSEEYTAACLVETLASNGRVSEWQRELLLTLLGLSDDRLLAAFDVYNDDEDLDEFLDTAGRLCDVFVWEKNRRSLERDWVHPLEEQGRAEPGVLQALVEARDERIMAAFIVFLGDNDGDEFADTLERIARIASSAKLNGSGATEALTESSAVETVDREVDPEAADGVLAWLSESGLISGEQWAEVQALYAAFHAQVLAAFDVYHATKDSEDLADTLQRILARCAALKKNGPLSPSTSKTGRMEKQLLHFANELGLAPHELAALKRSIARQDEILEAAVEVYEMEKDEEDLKDTLKRVAHHIVEAGRA